MRRILIACMLAIFLILGLAGVYHYQFPQKPLSSSDQQLTTYTLSKGTSVKKMVRQLQAAKLVSPLQGFLLARYIRSQKVERLLQAGEYAIPSNITPAQLIHKFKKGEVIQYAVTFSEGITFKQALALLQKHPAIQPTSDVTPEAIMVALGEPGVSPEGLFFPSTYYFPRGTSAIDVLKRSRQMMQSQVEKAYNARSPQCVLKSPYEVLVMASIIEKESALASERTMISGVFQRRLAQNMLLQADPTLIYGLQDRYTGRLTYENLKEDEPYNTYIRKGLPPTPIALPNLDAINAACQPFEGVVLYFVAKGDGSHHFSATLAEHQDAVKKYIHKNPVGNE